MIARLLLLPRFFQSPRSLSRLAYPPGVTVTVTLSYHADVALSTTTPTPSGIRAQPAPTLRGRHAVTGRRRIGSRCTRASQTPSARCTRGHGRVPRQTRGLRALRSYVPAGSLMDTCAMLRRQCEALRSQPCCARQCALCKAALCSVDTASPQYIRLSSLRCISLDSS